MVLEPPIQAAIFLARSLLYGSSFQSFCAKDWERNQLPFLLLLQWGSISFTIDRAKLCQLTRYQGDAKKSSGDLMQTIHTSRLTFLYCHSVNSFESFHWTMWLAVSVLNWYGGVKIVSFVLKEHHVFGWMLFTKNNNKIENPDVDCLGSKHKELH